MSEEWLNAISEEFRADPSLQTMKLGEGEQLVQVPPAMVKGYVHGQKMIGRDRVAIPGADAKPEDWDPVFKAIGRPDTHDRYEFKNPEKYPDFKAPDDQVAEFKQFAHKIGLSQAQAQAIYGFHLERTLGAAAASVEQRQRLEVETSKQLAAEWGDGWERKITWLDGLVSKYGGDAAVEGIKANNLGAQPWFIKLVAGLAENYVEARRVGTEKDSGVMTTEDAHRELNKLNADPEFQKALYDENHPGHKAAVERQSAVYQILYPDAEKSA